MIFEEFLKDTRKSLGVTQNELAERAGTTYQNISSYERYLYTFSRQNWINVEILIRT